MDREQKIAAIAREARKTRAPTPRAIWIAALVVGTLGFVGFAVILMTDGGSWSTSGPAMRGRLGFSAGILIGLVVGVGIGVSIGRHGTKSESHSSRNKP